MYRIYIIILTQLGKTISIESKYLLLDVSPTVLSLFPEPSFVAVLTLKEDDIDFPNPPLRGPDEVSFVKAWSALVKRRWQYNITNHFLLHDRYKNWQTNFETGNIYLGSSALKSDDKFFWLMLHFVYMIHQLLFLNVAEPCMRSSGMIRHRSSHALFDKLDPNLIRHYLLYPEDPTKDKGFIK